MLDGFAFSSFGLELYKNIADYTSQSTSNLSNLNKIIIKLKNGEYSTFCLLSAYNVLKKIAENDRNFPSNLDMMTSEIASQIFQHSSKIIELSSEEVSPKEIREYLESEGVLPTAAEAKIIFWALGESWWQQIIDGKFHQFGPRVFDEGLHGGPKEKGYLEGIEKGSKWFTSKFDQKMDLALYMEVHERASQHVTLNVFRTEEETARSPFPADLFSNRQNALKRFETLERHVETYISLTNPKESELKYDGFEPDSEKIIEQYKKPMLLAREWFKKNTPSDFAEKSDTEIRNAIISHIYRLKRELSEMTIKHTDKIEADVTHTCKRLSLNKNFLECYVEQDSSIKINYLAQPPEACREIIKKLFEEFNANLENLQKDTYRNLLPLRDPSEEQILKKIAIKGEYQEKVIKLISRLYAELEWLHPWIDGQGRTDLILLNGLLCREGLHPCILEEPYYSTTHSIEEWNNYLKAGLKAYEKRFYI